MFFHLTLGVLAIGLMSATGRAVTLDWDNVTTYTSGQPISSNSYSGSGTAGNDVTVSIDKLGAVAGIATEAVSTEMQGGLPLRGNSPESTLTITLNLTDQAQFVTVTVSFSPVAYPQGVNNVSFNLFDIDYSDGSNGFKFQDQVRSIEATAADGVTKVVPTISGSANNTVAGSGLLQTITGNTGTPTTPNIGAGSGNASATISFGATAIRSFTFTYGSGPGTVNRPDQQKIGLYDITFTPVPEVNPAIASAMICLFGVLAMKAGRPALARFRSLRN